MVVRFEGIDFIGMERAAGLQHYERRIEENGSRRQCKKAHISGSWYWFPLVRLPVVPKLSHRRILGEAIRHRRKLAALSQEVLAEKAELSTKYLGEVERGTVNISVDALLRIAKSLRVRLRDLVDEI